MSEGVCALLSPRTSRGVFLDLVIRLADEAHERDAQGLADDHGLRRSIRRLLQHAGFTLPGKEPDGTP